MALVISDRVKETSVTAGTGSITLTGAIGGFQSFLAAIGDGNQTYYTIENDTRWEVGIGTYTSSSNTLSRDTVLASSNSDAKITLEGVSFVFCTLPADRTLFKGSDGIIVSNSGTIGCSGLFTIQKKAAGSFFHAYVDDAYDETIALYSDADSTPEWRLGLKDSPSDVTAAPTYAYIFAEDGNIGLVANSVNSITLSHGGGLVVDNKGSNIFKASSTTGIHINSVATAYPALTVNGGVSLAADIQQWTTSAGTVLAAVDKDGDLTAKSFTATGGSSSGVIFFNADGVLSSDSSLIYDSSNEYLGIGTDSPDYELDVAGNIGLNQYIYHNGDTNTYIRFRGDQIDFVAGGRTMLTLDEAGTDKVIVNNSKADVDFQVEGDGDQYLIYTDAANDRVGIGTNEPAYKLDVFGNDAWVRASGFIVGNSGVVLASNTPTVTTNTLYNDGGTLSWNGFSIGVGSFTSDILANSASGVVISGIATTNSANISTNSTNITANTTALNASGDFLRTSGIAVSGWAAAYTDTQDSSVSGWVYATFLRGGSAGADILANSASGTVISGIADTNATTINSSGTYWLGEIRTNSASGVVVSGIADANTTTINASGDFLRTSGIAVSGWAKA